MTNASPEPPRLLFVIDNDFGALGVAMYLLHGQAIASRATVLLPRRAFALHGGRLGVACHPYGSLQDILGHAETQAPDVACLFSGYLMASQRLLRVHELRRLVGTLQARGCRVLTTDPYLGTFRRIVDAPLEGGRLAAFIRRMRMRLHVRRVAGILERVAHFYPVPVDAPAALVAFNARYLRSEGELAAIGAEVSALPGHSPAHPRWLFVLAQFDLDLQEKRHGIEGFADRVADRLRDANRSGRHATFIGPAAMVERLRARLHEAASVTLLAECPYDEFERRLLDAEIAFYWQVFSTSAFLRLWNGKPAYCFDAGHNSRLLEAFHATGLRRYYLGGAPRLLDLDAPLDAAALTGRKAEFRQYADQCRAKLEVLPDPDSLFASLPRA